MTCVVRATAHTLCACMHYVDMHLGGKDKCNTGSTRTGYSGIDKGSGRMFMAQAISIRLPTSESLRERVLLSPSRADWLRALLSTSCNKGF